MLVLDTGARGAVTTFVERGLGDARITWEHEALLAVSKLGDEVFGGFEAAHKKHFIDGGVFDQIDATGK